MERGRAQGCDFITFEDGAQPLNEGKESLRGVRNTELMDERFANSLLLSTQAIVPALEMVEGLDC